MAIQYDSESNKFTGWLSGLTSGFKRASAEATGFFSLFDNGDASMAVSKVLSKDAFDDFIKYNNLADESLIRFLGDTNAGEKTLANYQKWLKNSGNGMSAFSSLAKGAGKALKSLAASLGSMAAMWAIGELIGYLFTIGQRAEEARQEMIELGQQAMDTNKQISDLIDEYHKLGEDGKIDLSEQETAKNIQEQITKLVGTQADNLDLVNGKLDEEIEKLKKISVETANNNVATLLNAKTSAEGSLRSVAKGIVYPGLYRSDNEETAVIDVLKEVGLEKYGVHNNIQFGQFEIDTSSVDNIIRSYEDMVKLQNHIAINHRSKINKGGTLEDFYNDLTQKIKNMSDAVDKYKQASNNYDLNEAVRIFNNATNYDGSKMADDLGLSNGSLIKSKEDFDAYITSIENSEGISDGIKSNLIELANSAFPQLSDKAEEAGETASKNLNKTVVSLDNLKNASDGISSLSKAFKELSENGYITTDTLASIKEAVGTNIVNWDEYENKLLTAKVGTDEFNQIMTDLTYAILEAEFGTGGLVNATEEQIAAVLRENDVLEANTKAREILTNAIINEALATYDSIDEGYAYVEALVKEKLSAEEATVALAKYAKVKELLNKADKYEKDAESRPGRMEGVLLKKAQDARDEAKSIIEDFTIEFEPDTSSSKKKDALENVKDIIQDIEHEIKLAQNLDEDANVTDKYKQIQKIAEEEANRLRSLGYAETSDEIQELQNIWWDAQKNIDEYNADIFDAQIEREKTLYNARYTSARKIYDYHMRRIADLENKMDATDSASDKVLMSTLMYKEYDKAIRAGQADIEKSLKNASATRERLLGEYGITDATSGEWFDSDGSLNSDSLNAFLMKSNYSDKQKQYITLLAEALEADTKVYTEASENVAKAEKAKSDNIANLIDLLKTATQKAYDDWQKALDFSIAKNDSKLSVYDAYTSTLEGVYEAQKDINKELATSMKLYEYIDEDTRELLFNGKDYAKLNAKLNDILSETNSLYDKYTDELETATAETIDEITNQYERQLKLKMKEYETVKAQLDVEKKRQQLNNVLAEKNVRIYQDGKWTYVANTQDVIAAQEELADAEYEAARVERSMEQEIAKGKLEAENDDLRTKQNEVAKAWENLENMLNGDEGSLESLLQTIIDSQVPSLIWALDSSAEALLNFASKIGSSAGTTTNTPKSEGSNSGGWSTDKYDNGTYKALDNGKIPDGLGVGANVVTDRGTYTIVGVSPDGSYETIKFSDDTTSTHKGEYTKPPRYEDGILRAPRGFSIVNDGDGYEMLRTPQGDLIDLKGGETIYTSEQRDDFYNDILALGNEPHIRNSIPLNLAMDEYNNKIASLVSQAQIASNGNSETGETYAINGNVIIEGVNNPDEFVRELNRMFKNRSYK